VSGSAAWALWLARHMSQRGRRPPTRATDRRLSRNFVRYDEDALPLGTKLNDAEFMQYRNPVGFGPSSNT
jgi:hypothetical protein